MLPCMVHITYTQLHTSVQAFCAKCPMCKSNKTNLCGAVRKWTGNGIMKADDGVRFHHKESGKKIYHFVSSPFFSASHTLPVEPSCLELAPQSCRTRRAMPRMVSGCSYA